MKKVHSQIKGFAILSIAISLLTGLAFIPVSKVYAQPVVQEELPTEILEMNATETATPTSTPTEIPADIPTSAPTEIPTLSPEEVPPDLPSPTPEDVPDQIVEIAEPTLSPTPISTPEENIPPISDEISLPDGTNIDVIEIIGPPEPPPGFEDDRQEIAFSQAESTSTTRMLDVPAYNWVFGCSAVSGAMIAAYYDRTGFPNMYTGPTNGGVMPMNNGVWPYWSDGYNTFPSLPLAASKNGIDGRTTRGSIDDYWRQYGSSTSDPYISGGWTQHSWRDSIGDYMKTSQSAYGNVDSSTTFFNYSSGSTPLTCTTMENFRLPDGTVGLPDGTVGRKQFYEARGYTVTECYNQRTDNIASGGFSFSQFKEEIIAGRPVMINLRGHTVVGVGFDEPTNSIFINDTWDYSNHIMPWGGSYAGMALQSVSIVNLLPIGPSTPTLVSPNSGHITSNTSPTFEWDSAANGDTYQLQVSTLSNFSSLVIDTLQLGSGILTYTHADPFSSEGLYYWRVRAFDSDNNSGAWSTARTFTIDFTPPSAPILSSPDDDATPIGIPTFTWQVEPSANAYQFEYGLSADNGISIDPVFTSEFSIFIASYKPDSMPLGTLYFWHVRAMDAAGNQGEWSLARSVNIQASLPISPILSSPADKFLTNNQPTLMWNSVPGGVDYQIQISNSTQFTDVILVDSKLGGEIFSYTVATPLTDGTWFWRVRAWNITNGAGNWSTTRSFVFDKTGPSAPILNMPADNAQNIRAIPTFYWIAVSGAKGYQFQYDDDSAFSEPVLFSTAGDTVSGTPITATSYKPIGLPLVTDLFWRVRARDAAGNWGDWSSSRVIRILPRVPTAPVLSSPVSGLKTNVASAIQFSWYAVTTGNSYQIQMDELSSFLSPEVDQTLPSGELSYTLTAPISPDALYYWRVRAFNLNNDPGPWSSARKITMDTSSPGSSYLTNPSDNAANIRSNPSFYWTAVSGANAYQFQYDDESAFEDPILYSTPGGLDDAAFPGTPITKKLHKPAIPMTVMTPYFWRVRARDAAGNWGDWSSINNIQILPRVPTAPILSAPASGYKTNVSTPITFRWYAVTTGNNYQIQMDNLSSFFSPEIDQTLPAGELSYTLSAPISPDGLYYWRVRAINLNNEPGPWSGARKISFDTIAPSAAFLTLPLDNPYNLRTTPTFYWTAVIGANAYQFQYDDESEFTNPVLYSTPGGFSDPTYPGNPIVTRYHKPTLPMSTLIPHFWRVRARDAAGNWGDWSSPHTIQILP